MKETKLKISRSQSVNESRDMTPDVDDKSKTATPSLLTRWKRATVRGRSSEHSSEDSEVASPVDDLICLDSFEETTTNEEPHIIITKEAIRYDLLELLKGHGGHLDIVSDIEKPDIVKVSNSEAYLKKLSHFERNVSFLAAVLYNRHDLINVFLGLDIDLNFYMPQLGLGALHVAAFNGSVDFCDSLISQGVNVNAVHGIFTPLHCSAIGNSVRTARRLLLSGAVLNKVGPGVESVLHAAVRARSVECVRLFIESGIDINAFDSSGMNPLHHAADLGDVEIVQLLLACKQCDIDIPTRRDQNTALHLSAEGGSPEVIKLLLEKGAKANVTNTRCQTPLHLSSRVCLESTEALLASGADPNAADGDSRTPLHTAVSKTEARCGQGVTSMLINYGADPNRSDRYGYTPLHIAALNELEYSVESLISNGADVSAVTKGGTVALGLVSRKTPDALYALQKKLDGCITCSSAKQSNREIRLGFNFKYLLQGCQKSEMNFVQTFVKEGQRDLLEHPVCRAFLHLKWEKIRKYYITRIVFGFFHVLLLSIYVLTVLSYQCYKKEDPDEGFETRIQSNINVPTLCQNKSAAGLWLREHPRVVESEWFLLAAVTVIEIFRKLYGVHSYRSCREYFKLSNVNNIVEWFVIFAVFATSFIYTGDTHVWQNHVGAFAVLFGWANLMFMIGHLPIFGSYVAMYGKVQKEFAKLLSAYICILIGFTICFCAIFVKADEFDNPFVGFVKILVMMVGELEFGDLLKNIGKEKDSSSVLLETSALIIFVLFLLFVTIILINLLIGIAVDDIKGLKKTAGLAKLVGLSKLIAQLESAMYSNHLPGCITKLLNSSVRIPRAVLVVRPLNTQEHRLPRDIMRAGLEIARGQSGRDKLSRRSTFRRRRETDPDENQDLVDIILSLTADVNELKRMVREISSK